MENPFDVSAVGIRHFWEFCLERQNQRLVEEGGPGTLTADVEQFFVGTCERFNTLFRQQRGLAISLYDISAASIISLSRPMIAAK